MLFPVLFPTILFTSMGSHCLLNPSTKASASPRGGGCGPGFVPGFVLTQSSPGSSGHHLHLHLHPKRPLISHMCVKGPIPGRHCCPNESRAAEETPHRWGCHEEREATAGFPRGLGRGGPVLLADGCPADSTGHFPPAQVIFSPARVIFPQHFSREAGAVPMERCAWVPYTVSSLRPWGVAETSPRSRQPSAPRILSTLNNYGMSSQLIIYLAI